MPHLEEFINQERRRLQEFESMWIANNIKNEEHFPLHMREAEWMEQFLIFTSEPE